MDLISPVFEIALVESRLYATEEKRQATTKVHLRHAQCLGPNDLTLESGLGNGFPLQHNQ